MRLTDGRTDRILVARPRLHSMQRGKNAGRPPPQEPYLAFGLLDKVLSVSAPSFQILEQKS